VPRPACGGLHLTQAMHAPTKKHRFVVRACCNSIQRDSRSIRLDRAIDEKSSSSSVIQSTPPGRQNPLEGLFVERGAQRIAPTFAAKLGGSVWFWAAVASEPNAQASNWWLTRERANRKASQELPFSASPSEVSVDGLGLV